MRIRAVREEQLASMESAAEDLRERDAALKRVNEAATQTRAHRSAAATSGLASRFEVSWEEAFLGLDPPPDHRDATQKQTL